MVIGERFAWAHLPKTGGSATVALFQLFPEVIVVADLDDSNVKHTLFSEREAEVAGKRLVMNIRRLPFWVLSRAQHVARWGVHPDYEPIPIPDTDELADSDFPDDRLKLYTDGGRFEIDRWLRMEHMAKDFLDFIAGYADVTEERRAGVLEMPMVNKHDYDHDLASWFTTDQIDRMYERNPRWEAIEQQLYGDRVRLERTGLEASL
jgi:hypothetical protein